MVWNLLNLFWYLVVPLSLGVVVIAANRGSNKKMSALSRIQAVVSNAMYGMYFIDILLGYYLVSIERGILTPYNTYAIFTHSDDLLLTRSGPKERHEQFFRSQGPAHRWHGDNDGELQRARFMRRQRGLEVRSNQERLYSASWYVDEEIFQEAPTCSFLNSSL